MGGRRWVLVFGFFCEGLLWYSKKRVEKVIDCKVGWIVKEGFLGSRLNSDGM